MGKCIFPLGCSKYYGYNDHFLATALITTIYSFLYTKRKKIDFFHMSTARLVCLVKRGKARKAMDD